MLHSRTIRKIVFGESPLNHGLAFVVTNTFVYKGEKFAINYIEEDAQYFKEFGEMRYNVYVKKVGKDQVEFVWKSAIRVPTTIEYFMPNEHTDVVTVS